MAGANIIPYRMRGQKQRYVENERANTNRHSALKDYTKPNTKVKIQRQKVPDDEDIDIHKIVKGDKPKDDRNSATKIEKQYKEKEAKRLVLEKAKRIQMQKDTKDKEAKIFAIEKAQIEALIEKHRPRTAKTPDEVSTSGTGRNAKVDGQEGTEKGKPPYKKATKDSQIKKSHKKGEKAENADKGNPDTLLGDPVANTATGIEKAKEKGQKDKIGIDDVGIFEFIFYGLPELPELEGIDEDKLRELQNSVQEQLCQRDKERERNITKRVQEFEKTFDFVNSHLLKGVATMAELTKTDNRQPMGKIKPTDKVVMMPSLFDGTKPAMSKQHYERFNLYINFQTKSGHLTDPVREAIDLFEHTLDKTALVWFQMNRSKFKDLTTLKTMFLQRYNRVPAPDLLACSPERLVSHTCRMLCQLPRSISLHLKQVVLIGNLSECIDLPRMYCDAISRYLDPGIVPCPNFLPAVVFQLVLNYVVSIEWLHFDHFAGRTLMESLLELHLASLLLGYLYLGGIIGGSRGALWHMPPPQQDQFLSFSHTFSLKSVHVRGWRPPQWEILDLPLGMVQGLCMLATPVSLDYLTPDL